VFVRLSFRYWTCQAKDAAACVEELAKKGGQGIQCEIGSSSWFQDFCRIGNAKITASTGTQSKKSANW